jgi:hypothetical protein
MIAKKIETVNRRLEVLKMKVEPADWRLIRNAMNELADIAANVRAMEMRLRSPAVPAGLGLAEAFTEPDAEGQMKVNLSKVGVLLGDIAQVIQDNASRRPGPSRRKSRGRLANRPRLNLVAPQGGQ